MYIILCKQKSLCVHIACTLVTVHAIYQALPAAVRDSLHILDLLRIYETMCLYYFFFNKAER